jgi:hypothetical protein
MANEKKNHDSQHFNLVPFSVRQNNFWFFKVLLLLFSLSIWNTMMGTSLLSVPWALSQSGLATGLVIAFGMSMVAAYTASIILKTHHRESESAVFSDSIHLPYLVCFIDSITYVYAIIAAM